MNGNTTQGREQQGSGADRKDASYIVIGGRKRPKVKGIFGSVTQSVLLSAVSSVRTVMSNGE